MKRLLAALLLLPLLSAPVALAAQEAKKKEPVQAAKAASEPEDVSRSSGSRSCSATSGDGKKSCAVSCKDNESAECSNTETEADCACK